MKTLGLLILLTGSSWLSPAHAETSRITMPATVEGLILLLEDEHAIEFRDCSTSRLRVRFCSKGKVETTDVRDRLRSAIPESDVWEESKKRSRVKTVLGSRSLSVTIHKAKQSLSIEFTPALPDCVLDHDVPDAAQFQDEPSFAEPTMVHRTPAETPSGASQDGKNARIVGMATINVEGRIVETCLIKVSTEGYGFEAEFFKSLRQWRFEPATLNGEPIAVRFTVMTEWSLGAR